MSDIDTILSRTSIEGLDINDALSRVNHSGKIYLRIVHSFSQNMPKMLDDLATVSKETLPDYAIRVHGVKGSCYGIGAVACGDAAFALEKASKAGDWATVERDNGTFIALVKKLITDLEALEARVEASPAPASGTAADNDSFDGEGLAAAGSGSSCGEGLASEAQPDAAKLAALLEATKNYDLKLMRSIIEDLESSTCSQGSELVTWLREQLNNFAYDKIIARLYEL